MAQDILKDIIAKKRERLAQAKVLIPEEQLKESAGSAPAARSLSAAINRPRQISLIAEIKKASPSRGGLLRPDFDHRAAASAYKEAGVQAVSVITEEDFFQGNPAWIKEVKEIIDVPVLRKDFILEPYQMYESRALGADAVLLIAAALSQDTLVELLALGAELGMECLVEVHTEKELKKVSKLKTSLIGINNRDLRTLAIDLKTTETLFPLVHGNKTVVVESGITSRKDLMFLKILGVNAALIGHAFIEAPDIKAKVEEIMGW